MAEYNFTIENKTSSGYDQLYPATKGEQVDVSSVASAIGESGPLNVEQALTSLYATATNKTGFPKIVTTIANGSINSEMGDTSQYYSYTLPFAKTLTKLPTMVYLEIGRGVDREWDRLSTVLETGASAVGDVRMFLIRQDDGTFNAYARYCYASNAPLLPSSSTTTYDMSKRVFNFGWQYFVNIDKEPTRLSSDAPFEFTYYGNNATTFSMQGGTAFCQYPTSATANRFLYSIGAFKYDLSGVTFKIWYQNLNSSTNYNLVRYRGIVYE